MIDYKKEYEKNKEVSKKMIRLITEVSVLIIIVGVTGFSGVGLYFLFNMIEQDVILNLFRTSLMCGLIAIMQFYLLGLNMEKL